ncbi:MAG: hypothetical protein HC843_11060 [Sphingomonadales bacterium]|nr:hypothetical protein [Sphingomonadales bacterium]
MASRDKQLLRMVRQLQRFTAEDQSLILNDLSELQQDELQQIMHFGIGKSVDELDKPSSGQNTLCETGNLSFWIVDRMKGEVSEPEQENPAFKVTDFVRCELGRLAENLIPQPLPEQPSLTTRLFGWIRGAR